MSSPDEPILRLEGIQKRFGPVEALAGLDLIVRRGEIIGIAGDNAAGKSTLMKIISGAYQHDAGRVLVNGEEIRFRSPQDARARGIESVYQEFALAPDLSVLSNIFLGRELTRRTRIGVHQLDHRGMRNLAEGLLRDLGIDIPSLTVPVSELSGGQRQAVAITRAMTHTPHLIILDEPTANLSVAKVQLVLELLRRLRGEGVAVLLVTHRLQDIFEIADRVVVLRQGRIVVDSRTGEASVESVVDAMVGDAV